MLAYGAMAGLKAAGAHVPGSISVVGIDNIPVTNMNPPGLTTVDTAAGMLAQRAAQLVIDMPEDNEDILRNPLSMKPELVIRDSVQKI